ncbi:hypothetical protein EI94DRAFT_1705327 [Lactarius quietus]|nr:hypothetical protein EI94DRAFT_1705327 [Lactarius quietus]
MPIAPGTPSDHTEKTHKGERQQRPCKPFADDGDPVPNKKLGKNNILTAQSSTSSITSVRTNTTTTSTRTAEKTVPDSPPCAQPRTQPHAPEDGKKSDGTLFDPEVIEVNSKDSVELIEDDDEELERLSKDWDAPIYTFFKPMPVVEYIDQHKAHVFEFDKQFVLTCKAVLGRGDHDHG